MSIVAAPNAPNQQVIDPKTGRYTQTGLKWAQNLTQAVNNGLTLLGKLQGDISALAKIGNRPEPIGVTVQNLTTTGQLNSLTNVAADVNTDHVADGTGSPLTGGKRGYQALDVNNRLQNSFRQTPVNVSNTPTSSTSLSNSGSSTAITIAAGTNQFAPSGVSYNGGSVDPGAYGTYYIYALDPTFAGGAVTYLFSNTPVALTSNEGIVPFGAITTVSGSNKTGGGYSGGTTGGGGAGGRGYINTL